MAAKKKKKRSVKFDDVFPAVTVKGTSCNKGTVRVGLGIPDSACTWTKARKYFHASQLTLRLVHDTESKGDVPGQAKLLDTSDEDIIFDCKTAGFSFRSSAWGVSVQLPLDSAPYESLAKLSGTVCAMSVKWIGKDESTQDEPEEETEPDESAEA